MVIKLNEYKHGLANYVQLTSMGNNKDLLCRNVGLYKKLTVKLSFTKPKTFVITNIYFKLIKLKRKTDFLFLLFKSYYA